jgi:hypothetical protein
VSRALNGSWITDHGYEDEDESSEAAREAVP